MWIALYAPFLVIPLDRLGAKCQEFHSPSIPSQCDSCRWSERASGWRLRRHSLLLWATRWRRYPRSSQRTCCFWSVNAQTGPALADSQRSYCRWLLRLEEMWLFKRLSFTTRLKDIGTVFQAQRSKKLLMWRLNSQMFCWIQAIPSPVEAIYEIFHNFTRTT